MGIGLFPVLCWQPATAQLLRAVTDVQAQRDQEAREAYEPLGLRFGTVVVHPSLRSGVLVDSNAFLTENDEKRAAALQLSGRVSAESRVPGRSLQLEAGADQAFYTVDDNDPTALFLGGKGQTTVGTRDEAALGLVLSRVDESRSSPDQENVRALTAIDTAGADASYRLSLSRLFVQGAGSVQRLTFDNPDEDQTFRDRTAGTGELLIGSDLTPRLALYGIGRVQRQAYDEQDEDGNDQSSTSVFMGGGGDVNVTDLLEGYLDLGVVHRFSDDSQDDDFTGFASSARLAYAPTPLTRLRLIGRIGLDETSVEVDGEPASSVYVHGITLGAAHDLEPNLQLSGEIEYRHAEFVDTSRDDDDTTLSTGLRWSLNRNLVYDVGLALANRRSSADGESFKRAVLSTGVTLTF